MRNFIRHQAIKGLLLASVILAATLAATHASNASDWRDDVDMSRADLAPIKLVLMNEGKAAGRMEYSWERRGDTYVIQDLTQMEPNILETVTGVIDAETLQPKSVYVDFAIGTSKVIVEMDWVGDHLTGAIIVHSERQEDRVTKIDTVVTAPLRLSVFGLIPALLLTEGYTKNLPWFSSISNQTEQVTLTVVGTETVETPAGSYDTFKIAITGSSTENFVYVSKSLPRKIIRIDVVGQPIQFLLSE